MIDLVDYGGGNIGSVTRTLERLNVPYQIVDSGQSITGGHPLLLPGVGAFGGTMAGLAKSSLGQRIREVVLSGVPYLGICVGLQILFDGSEEAPGVEGLGLIAGQIVRYREGKIPQIGWNRVTSSDEETYPSGYVYFVNSYYPQPENSEVSLYQADYHGPFCAAIRSGNITAFQFHPEKSGVFGHELIRSWADANT